MLERLTIFYQNVPFPPIQGGKADVWRRIVALQRLGVKIQLVHWSPNRGAELSGEIAESLDRVIESRISLTQSGRFEYFGIFDVFRYPMKISPFRMGKIQKQDVLEKVRKFDAQAILVEGPWTFELASFVSSKLNIPLLYRSHNIEHQYLKKQANLMSHWHQKIIKLCAILNLQKFEFDAMNAASAVFDISADDMEYWAERGIRNIWLPPIAESLICSFEKPPLVTFDVLFFGNLMTPNNVQGVNWLLDEVWPLVQAKNVYAKLAIAGSGPNTALINKISKLINVELLKDVSNAAELYRQARVHVNPVMIGSGVQLKTVEMLVSGGDVISTTQGLSGLPQWIKESINPVDDAEGFADRILKALAKNDPKAQPDNSGMKETFSADSVRVIIAGYPKYFPESMVSE